MEEEIKIFNMEEVRELSVKIINKNGIDNQLTKLIEEMSELTKEICKFKLYGERRHVEGMMEECVDVSLMLMQLELILNKLNDRNDSLAEIMQLKINKLRTLANE